MRTERPDVVLSDIAMPGEDGYLFIHKVRGLPRLDGGDTPAIALKAYARAEDQTRALRAGFTAHASKPIELSALLALIARVAKRPRAR